MMHAAQAPLDDATRQRVQQLLLLSRRVTLLLHAAFDRVGIGEVRTYRGIQVLMRIHRVGALRPRELQGPLRVSSGGLTKVIDRLVQLDLVERSDEGEHDDGRAVFVRLTRRGRSAVRRLHRGLAEVGDECRRLAGEMLELADAAGTQPTRLVSTTEELMDLPEAIDRMDAVIVSALADGNGVSGPDDVPLVLTLCQIDLHEGCRPGSLVDVLGLSSGGVSKLLDRIEANGWIAREYGTIGSDRRAVVLNATEAGDRLLHDRIGQLASRIDEFSRVARTLTEHQPATPVAEVAPAQP